MCSIQYEKFTEQSVDLCLSCNIKKVGNNVMYTTVSTVFSGANIMRQILLKQCLSLS